MYVIAVVLRCQFCPEFLSAVRSVCRMVMAMSIFMAHCMAGCGVFSWLTVWIVAQGVQCIFMAMNVATGSESKPTLVPRKPGSLL